MRTKRFKKQYLIHRQQRVSRIFPIILSGLVACALIFTAVIAYLNFRLPSVAILKNIQLQVPLRIYSADGKLIGEYGDQHRIPVALSEVPPLLIKAVLDTEDYRFYQHHGVDLKSMLRSAWFLLTQGYKGQGGSTITMQVVRNFFLNREKTFLRKLNEILLALKIESNLSKDEILDLYLNKIFLGNHAYGMAAAAQIYYGKKLSELNLAEIAMLAGLPKAPSSINPINDPEAAFQRRKHVLDRMLYYQDISQEDYNQAVFAPVKTSYHGLRIELQAPYVAEMVRAELLEIYGEQIYTKGLQVYTTIDSQLQKAALHAVRSNLLEYTERHPNLSPNPNWGLVTEQNLIDWKHDLANLPVIAGLHPGVVTELNAQNAKVLLASGKIIQVELSNVYKVQPGDLVKVYHAEQRNWKFGKIPEVEGSLVALDAHTGEIRALVGGFSHQLSHFNRVTQAKRQIGSNIKPFIYSAALAKNYTAASLINDAPIAINDPNQEQLWRPQNDNHHFYGLTRLRVGLIKSRNLVSIRLLNAIGLPYVKTYLAKFGFDNAQLPNDLSLALGTASVTPLQVVSAYAAFANGGYRIYPNLLSHIDLNNQTIYHQPLTVIPAEQSKIAENPTYVHPAQQIITPHNAYIITDMLKDAIKNGTAQRAKVLNRHDLAGKTGTTNSAQDAWYSGYNYNLVVTTWMGFDTPKGLQENAASTALPMWIRFMAQALKNVPEHEQPQPEDLIMVKIDPSTGLLATEDQKDAIFELFNKANVPTKFANQDESQQFSELAAIF